MTTEQLHDILDDENRTLTIEELKEIVYELKSDCFNEMCKYSEHPTTESFYNGEMNAFYITLDLLEHVKLV